MVVFSGSWSDRLKHVRALLERLKVANPTVNLGKSEIARVQSAFEKAKALLATAPILMAPNFSRLFVLYTDASDVGIEAVLVQADDSGVEHPVALFSKKLRPNQVRYSTIEKKTLALVLA